MKIVFMGTPDFAAVTLDALVLAGYDIALVVTQPDKAKGRSGKLQMSDVGRYAADHDLEVFKPERIKDEASVARLKETGCDLIVVAAFGQILSREVLDIPRLGCINVHASLLPKLRGASPIQTAILDGEKVTGVTIMQMGEGLDTGDMLSQVEVEIADDDTGGSLFDKLAHAGGELLIDTIKKLEKGEITPVPQDEASSSYARMIKKDMGSINWSDDAESIERMIRALNPWPSAYTYINGKTLKIWSATVTDGSGEIGCVGDVTKDGFSVYCKNGALRIKELQLEGRKRMSAHDFLLGFPLKEGDRLTSRED